MLGEIRCLSFFGVEELRVHRGTLLMLVLVERGSCYKFWVYFSPVFHPVYSIHVHLASKQALYEGFSSSISFLWESMNS